jgi:hypothetical protein
MHPEQLFEAEGFRVAHVVRITLRSLPENQDVLAWEVLEDLVHLESLGLQLGFDLFDRHLMFRADRHLGVFAAVFE